MIKNVICFFILLICIAPPSDLAAQELFIEGINNQQFHGVKPIEGKGYYTFYRKDKGIMAKSPFMLEIFDLDLNLIKSSPIELSRKAKLQSGTFNGKYFLFSFVDPKSRKVTYRSLDSLGTRSGKDLKEKIKRNFLKQRKFHPSVYPSGDSGFYILDYTKGKKIGYRVRKLDNTLKLIWEEKFIPEKGQAIVLQVESKENRLLLVRQIVEKSSFKEPVREMVVLDGAKGITQYTFPLDEEEVKLSPSAILIEENSSVVCAGMYKPVDNDSENPGGLFFLKLDPSGNPIAFKQSMWDGEIKESIEKHAFGVAWWRTHPKILFQEIKKMDSGYQFIGETFRQATSGTAIVSHMVDNTGPGASLAVLDFIVFDVDDTLSEIQNTHFIPKEKMTVWIPTIGDNDPSLDNYFKKYDLLSYRFTQKWENDLNAIVFYNWGRGKPYIGYAPLTDAIRINPQKIYLSKEAAKFGSANVIPSKKGQVLIYEHDNKSKTLKMWIESLN